MTLIQETFTNEAMVQALYRHIEDAGLPFLPTYAEALDALNGENLACLEELLQYCSN